MSAYEIESSAELMTNYVVADVLAPQQAFVALQTLTGSSLLFSIGTDQVLYVTRETPGTATGWERDDLSSAQAAFDFPAGATCRTFAAAQVAGPSGEIHLAMVLTDAAGDHVYVSLGNSGSATTWVAPTWTGCPFNALDDTGKPLPAPAPLRVAGVLLSEASDAEYVVVDVLRDPGDPAPVLERFYLDLTTPSAPRWVRHDVADDVSADGYSSVLGRAAGKHAIDGLYTHGVVGTATQLSFAPLYNVWASDQPAPTSRLSLPGGAAVDAIAACRNTDETSDLYVAGDGALYRFASSNQHDGAVGALVLSHPIVTGVRDLYASVDGDVVTVWGLNGSDAVFYVSCPVAELDGGGAWSVPLPILSGVDAISPYVDRQYSANTFFAHGANGLLKAVKTPSTLLWQQRPVTLPPADAVAAATKVTSFTTHLRVTTTDGQVAPGVTVSLTATSVTAVLVNHLYYRVGPEPVEVTTDELGTVTIVEVATTLAATRFVATVADVAPVAVNPMDAPFARNARYTTADSLRGAVITATDGSTRPFVPPGTSDGTLAAVAASNTALGTAYQDVGATPSPTQRAASPAAAVAVTSADALLVDVGDLFRWLESGVDAVVSVVKNAATDVWHFVAAIGEQVYEGVLDCVEHVVAAVLWVYNAIKVAVEDVLEFLAFLFSWPDIVTTHRVLKNVFRQYAVASLDTVADWKAGIATTFDSVRQSIDSWAALPPMTGTASSTVAANQPLPGQHGAPANLGVHHLQGSGANASTSKPIDDGVDSVLADLVAVLQAEEQVVIGACDAVKSDIVDQFSTLTATEVVERLAAILADALLDSIEKVVTTAIDVLVSVARTGLDLLDYPLSIPVLSNLYEELTGDELSILDVVCLVAAIPATIVYKLTTDEVPFPRGDAFTTGLTNATSFAEVQAQFVVTPAAGRSAALATAPAAFAATASPVLDQRRLKVFGLTSGVAALFGSVALVIVSGIQKALDAIGENARPKTLAAIGCAGNIAYVSPNIATVVNAGTATWYGQLNNALTGVSILKGVAAIPFATSTSPTTPRVFAGIETTINVVWNVPVVMNVVENHQHWDTTYDSLIPETIGNFAFNAGGILELPILLTKEPVTKVTEAAVQAGLMLLYGVLMVVSGGIYEGAANQEH